MKTTKKFDVTYHYNEHRKRVDAKHERGWFMCGKYAKHALSITITLHTEKPTRGKRYRLNTFGSMFVWHRGKHIDLFPYFKGRIHEMIREGGLPQQSTYYLTVTYGQ